MQRSVFVLVSALFFAAATWVYYAPSKQALALAHGIPCEAHELQHYDGDHFVSVLDCFAERQLMVERPRPPSWRDWVLPNLLATSVEVH